MSTTSLVFDLIGALAIGYLIGYFYSKSKFFQKFKDENKKLRDSINSKDIEIIEIKKVIREQKKIHQTLEDEIKSKDKIAQKRVRQFNNLKVAVSLYKDKLKDKKAEIKELEALVLDIQKDYATLQDELEKQKEINKELKADFKEKIEHLTQKANDLYMVKGTEELKSAKKVFDNLRELSLNKLKG